MSLISAIINNNTIEKFEVTSSAVQTAQSNFLDITIPAPASNMIINRAVVTVSPVDTSDNIILSFNKPETVSFECPVVNAVTGVTTVSTSALYVEDTYNCNLLKLRLSYKTEASDIPAGTTFNVRLEGVRTQPFNGSDQEVNPYVNDTTLRILRFDNINTQIIDLTKAAEDTVFVKKEDFLLIGSADMLNTAKIKFDLKTVLSPNAKVGYSYWNGSTWKALTRTVAVTGIAAITGVVTTTGNHLLTAGTPVQLTTTSGSVIANRTYYVAAGTNPASTSLTLVVAQDGSGTAIVGGGAGANTITTTPEIITNSTSSLQNLTSSFEYSGIVELNTTADWVSTQIISGVASMTATDPLYTLEKNIKDGNAYPIGFLVNPDRYWLKIQPTTDVTLKINSIKLVK